VNLLACQAIGVPYALVSQSLGPIRWYNRPLTRYCLNRARLIYIREKRTLQMLTEMGVEASLLNVAPDLAFALPASTANEVDNILDLEFHNLSRLPRPWIGISVSALPLTRLKHYDGNCIFKALRELIEHLNRTLGGTVFLVPHEIRPATLGLDDVSASEFLSKSLRDPTWLQLLRGDYSPSDLKGIISRFDAFVACRMHAGIAALSSGVPTLMISWSHKYEGVMEELALSQFVWRPRFPSRNLISLFDEMWHRRGEVSRQLQLFNADAGSAIQTTIAKVLSFV
jgi:polysaccharide pyruvyl transferase WcaK-like protein